MPELGQRDFSSGWIPDGDPINGDSRGLLRMDNVHLDEKGSLTLIRGADKVSPLQPDAIAGIYSKVLNGVKHRYIYTLDGVVKKDVDEAKTFSTTVLSGGESVRTGFGSALGHVLITSGSLKKKDDGASISNLGISAPGAPTAVLLTKPAAYIDGGHVAWSSATEGIFVDVSYNEGIKVLGSTDSTTGRFIIKHISSQDGSFSGATQEDDVFLFSVKFKDSSTAVKARIEVYLNSSSGDATGQEKDNFFIEFNQSDIPNQFNLGASQWSTFRANRSDFTRVGENTNLGWSDIETVVVSFEAGPTEALEFGDIKFLHAGSLKGEYDYYQQNMDDNGIYLAKSPVGTLSLSIIADGQHITVTPASLGGADKAWIFRRKRGIHGTGTWYRIKEVTSASSFTDDTLDIDAVNDGIEVNLFLAALPDDIIDIVGTYGDRTIYLTWDEVLISDSRNPDAIETRAGLDFSGDQTERNLWIMKSDANSLLVGTTEDIYQIQGTLELLADGTIDARIIPLGIGNPPISTPAALYNHQVIYMASDGWRITSGAVTQAIVGETSLLYNGENRHGHPSVSMGAQNSVTYDCAVHKGKLFTMSPLSDGDRRVIIYDFEQQYWYASFMDPVSLYEEEDGTLLAGFGDAGDHYLRKIDDPDTKGFDNDTAGFAVTILSPFIDAQLPNRRKDVYTLKILADTNNAATVTIKLAKDSGSLVTIASGVAFNGVTLKTYEINSESINLGKSFQIQITGTMVDFKLLYWALDYEVRPEQLNHLRIPPTNYGVAGRKRFYHLPFEIDTLGNTVTVTPNVDRSAQSTSTVNYSGKGTYAHIFTSELKGFELGADLQAAGDSVFEFYGLVQPRAIEALPDRMRFLAVPSTNFGIPSKKRIRTIPFVIDTEGNNVTLTPYLDGVAGTTSIINTTGRRTAFHYFTTDVFFTDYKMEFSGANPFEFYEMLKPEEVEILPVAKKFDQIGPTEFAKLAKFRSFRVRMIAGGTTVNYKLFGADASIATGSITTVLDVDDVYEVNLPKTIKGTIIRLELDATAAFHRYWVHYRYTLSGHETSMKEKVVQ